MPSDKISNLNELATTPADDDLVAIVDVTANETKKITIANILSAVLDSVLSKAINIENPTNSEDRMLFYTDEAITFTKIAAILKGSLTPSVTYTIRHDPDRNAVGTELVTGGSIVTSTTNGDIVIVFDAASVLANRFIWIETTAKSGTVTELSVTVIYN